MVGAAGFANVAGLDLVVGIAAETLSPGASAEVGEVSFAAFAAVLFAFVSGVSVLFAGALLAFAADDDVVEAFTVAVFGAFVFAFAFVVSAFTELFVAAFAVVFAGAALTLFAAVFVSFTAVAFVDFAAVAFAGALFATAFAVVFLAAAFFAGAAFLTAAAALLAADFTPLDFVAVFLAVVVAALGIRSTSRAVQAAPP